MKKQMDSHIECFYYAGRKNKRLTAESRDVYGNKIGIVEFKIYEVNKPEFQKIKKGAMIFLKKDTDGLYQFQCSANTIRQIFSIRR